MWIFTKETTNKAGFNFLYVKYIDFQLYKKKTDKDVYLNYLSHFPEKYKLSIIKNASL